jgi:type IV pilus assembly protein PilQ
MVIMNSIAHRKWLGMTVIIGLISLVFFGGSIAIAAPELMSINSIEVKDGKVVLQADSSGIKFEKYLLGAPTRLVVDVKNAVPQFSERSFDLSSGFKLLRVGLYADKTRFVFDVSDQQMPEAQVTQVGSQLIVHWGDVKKTQAVIETSTSENHVVPKGQPFSIERVDFSTSSGISIFEVILSGKSELISPQVEGDVIRFGIKNTLIPRSLRRVVDASVFPSSVLQITPYSTVVNDMRNVMFAARMKGPVEYRVDLVDNKLVFSTQDGPFAEPAAKELTSVVVPVNVGAKNVGDEQHADELAGVIESIAAESSMVTTEDTISGDSVKVYTGEPISLVFDDADIRKVMQLLAEISDMNLILSEEVVGNITLRLHDVPWDQALDLILEIKELGTITQGNVVRVLPSKQIQAMETDRLRAKKTIEKLEDTETRIYEVSYKDTDTFEDVIEDIMSEQGEVRTIDGSKKIMVNDIPSKLVEIQQLLQQLDEPVKQVMIEARIVEANTTEGLDLGINWGLTYNNDDTGEIGIEHVDTGSAGLGGGFLLPSSLGVAGLGADLTFGRTGFDNLVLDMKLSALETSGNGRVISSPKVLTLDGEEAKIEQGTAIPYQSVSDQGTTTEFQDATLSLEVTPEVNPDNTIILEIKASNSTIGSTVSTGAGSAPSIDTKEAETKLLLKDGETTVIGGIYVENTQDSETGTPFLKDIPYLGKLFKSNSHSLQRSELLIFITPHIVAQ